MGNFLGKFCVLEQKLTIKTLKKNPEKFPHHLIPKKHQNQNENQENQNLIQKKWKLKRI